MIGENSGVDEKDRFGCLEGLAVFGIVSLAGAAMIMSSPYTKTVYKAEEEVVVERAIPLEERPTFSIIEKAINGDNYFQVSFYDRDHDEMTVERVDGVRFGDYGTGVDGVRWNLERKDMSDREKVKYDGLYQTLRRGVWEASEEGHEVKSFIDYRQ